MLLGKQALDVKAFMDPRERRARERGRERGVLSIQQSSKLIFDLSPGWFPSSQSHLVFDEGGSEGEKKKRCFGGKAKHGDNCRALFSTDKKIWIPVHLHANVWARSGSQSELEQVAQVGRISSFKSFSALMTFIKITSLNMWSLVY